MPMPLPESDYYLMNCPRDEFLNLLPTLQEKTRYYVANTTYRLAETEWIARKLEEEVKRGAAPVAHEGLLSLQIYLLLTCADTLGHLYATGGVGDRFKSFFKNLPEEIQQNLLDDIIAWQADRAELTRLGLIEQHTGAVILPYRSQLVQFLQSLSLEQRFETLVNFLYRRRNYYTHESRYPQLGHHPNLSVMQRQRLNISNTATLGELDRLQLIPDGDHLYFAYYETDDPIATIRKSIVQGLGRAIGRV